MTGVCYNSLFWIFTLNLIDIDIDDSSGLIQIFRPRQKSRFVEGWEQGSQYNIRPEDIPPSSGSQIN